MEKTFNLQWQSITQRDYSRYGLSRKNKISTIAIMSI